VKKPTGGFDNGLGAILIGEHSLASFLSKKSPEGILGLFQQHRSKRESLFDHLMSAPASSGQTALLNRARNPAGPTHLPFAEVQQAPHYGHCGFRAFLFPWRLW
jgi:hypothetical protein